MSFFFFFFCCLGIIFKINIFKKKSQIPSVSNSLDPDQARHFVRPDLGPNCLQTLSADDQKMTLVGKELKVHDSSLILINNIYFLNFFK